MFGENAVRQQRRPHLLRNRVVEILEDFEFDRIATHTDRKSLQAFRSLPPPVASGATSDSRIVLTMNVIDPNILW